MTTTACSTNQTLCKFWPWPKPDPPAPPPPSGDVEFSYNPQDRSVLDAGTVVIGGVGAGPTVEKAKLNGANPAKDGKYVFAPGEQGFVGALAFSSVARTIKIFEEALGEPIRWAFNGTQLRINADAGRDLNAFYSRQGKSLNFFHETDPVTRQVVYSGGSGEVAAHEAGHAILDGLRPGYLGAWSPDPGGFHESFGDVLAMLVCLQDDRCLQRVVEQTGGDLSIPNMASHLGEELGTAINNTTGKNVTGGNYTRTAINSFVWQDPSTLPEKGGPDQLGRAVHSYSRLWTGSFYDVLKGMVNSNREQGMEPFQAIRAASTEALKLYGGLMKTAPRGDHTYRDMARALVAADRQYNNGARSELITRVFTDRRILNGREDAETPSFAQADARVYQSEEESTRPQRVLLQGPEFRQFDGAVVDNLVDKSASMFQEAESADRVKDSLKHLIAAGRILYTDPGKPVSEKDLFDPHGQPYTGVVRWENGQMVIERVKILSTR
ncbi:MAG: hypothetical protein AMXMBFR33_02870 [Candidatus Xenobia bacterium]|jgi:hypothetical protein